MLKVVTGVCEQNGGEGRVVGLVDDPEPDVVTPINKVVLLADKISFYAFLFQFLFVG